MKIFGGKIHLVVALKSILTRRVFTIPMQAVFALAIASIPFGVSGRSAAPAGLLVNGVGQPLAVDRGSIRFTWMTKDATRGETQTA